MPLTFEQSKDRILKLAGYFAANLAAFRQPAFKEAHARQEFIDPLFFALNWDVRNEQHSAPDYREVVVEDALDVEGQKKAPDYAFRVGSQKIFYAEAKRPGVALKTASAPAYQLRRYAWSAKLALSILTDFEELAVYDCRIKPKNGDPSTVARVNYFAYGEYADRWNEVWDVFSRDAVLGGSFDRFAQSARGKRGASEVDAEFLKEIERWRDVLARNIAIRNPELTIDELNDAVQRTIDRVIFLRMAEDRQLEPYGRLREIAEQEGVYAGLLDLARKADARYNSGLFDFSKSGDRVTPRIAVDDKPLAGILKELYYPQSPYEFSVLPAEILGNVYEQFLGKVIRLTAGHQAKVEEKPEVKKAGGVYYTPAYIVDYIVKNTVGQQVEGKSPRELEGYRVLDMACGSGSFLLGAYQYLLDHCKRWYEANKPEKHPEAVWRHPDGRWLLTVPEKKRILTAHVHGVDIDRQAVEVTKLSLLLKVLEGEKQAEMFQEKALPNLDANIKCGNSLIGPDYFAGQMLPDPEELRRVNPFDWEKEFPEAMRAGGFDCVIGNPPYIRIQTMKEWAPTEVEAYKKLYASAGAGNYDIYVVFLEKGLGLLNPNGRLGFILPHKFFNSQYGAPIRKIIASGKHLSEIVHFGDQQVFIGATTYTCLLFLNKRFSTEFNFQKVDDLSAWLATGKATKGVIPSSTLEETEWNFVAGAGAALFKKMNQLNEKLGDVATRMYQGPITSADSVFLFKDFRIHKKGQIQVFSIELNDWVQMEANILKRVVRSGDIGRYSATATALVLFPYEVRDCKARLYSAEEMQGQFPLTWNYLIQNKKHLESREKGRFRDSEWYKFGRTQNLGLWEQPKLMVPYMISRLAAYYDVHDEYYFINVTTGGYGISTNDSCSLEYLCGLLNSRLVNFYFKNVATTFRGGYYAANKQFIEQIPIRIIDFTSSSDIANHDKVVSLVNQMLDLNKQKSSAKDAGEQERLQRLIDSTDKQIDALVYELYGLTDEEIRIVEGA